MYVCGGIIILCICLRRVYIYRFIALLLCVMCVSPSAPSSPQLLHCLWDNCSSHTPTACLQ